MNIIFLDIDGVLNSQNYFIENHKDILLFSKAYSNKDNNELEYLIKRQIMDIDYNKLQLLKEIIYETNAKIVISSSWRNLYIYPLIEDYLINKGLPIIGTTPYIRGKRGEEIRTYLKENPEIKNFIILDDEIFKDFNELENYLIKTDFYNEGLEESHANEAIKILKKN